MEGQLSWSLVDQWFVVQWLSWSLVDQWSVVEVDDPAICSEVVTPVSDPHNDYLAGSDSVERVLGADSDSVERVHGAGSDSPVCTVLAGMTDDSVVFALADVDSVLADVDSASTDVDSAPADVVGTAQHSAESVDQENLGQTGGD